jgi:putative transposase
MKPSLPQRKPLRLKSVDYSQNGAYFITLCTENRAYLFGKIVDAEMVLNNLGRIVESVWYEMPLYYPDILLDAFVIMPNHIHCVLFIVDKPTDLVNYENPVGETLVVSRQPTKPEFNQSYRYRTIMSGRPQGSPLQKVVTRFKSTVTVNYINKVKHEGWQPFEGKIWQRGYHDQIIRNEAHLNEVRRYIANNPAQWAFDEENQNNP